MGPVFRAYDAERERLVAVKLFKLDVPPDRVHRLVAEFERLVAADLTHPAIARPVATGIGGVAAYLVQDYVAAESLDLAVREYGPAPAADTLRVAAQLAGALDYAAVVGVHHGALHPRDVLLSAHETRLTGLGVAQALQKVGVAVPVRRPYTAPELINGDEAQRRVAGDGGAKADLFSLAAIIYELLSAKRIAGTGETAVDAAALDFAGADRAALRRVFARALAEDPHERFETALAFANALRGAWAPDLVGASPLAASVEPAEGARQQSRELPFDVPEASDRADIEPTIVVVPSVPDGPTVDDEPLNEFAGDLPLAAAQEQRYQDVEAGPAPAEDASEDRSTPATPSALPPHVFSASLEPSRAAVWPLALALAVGLAVGFAGGYGFGSHDRSAQTSAAVAPGREFTDAAVQPTDRAAAEPRPEGGIKRDTPPVARPAPKPAPAAGPAAASTAAAAAAPTAGRLLVRSTPAGARVNVDGKDVGATPAVVRNLAPGTHRVRVSRDGYSSVERRVVITRSRPSTSLTVPLERERVAARGTPTAAPGPTTPGTVGRFVGGLSVDSRPTGAKVFLDGKLIGTTPLAMSSVAAGEHAIRLEYDGYRRWTSSVRVVATEQNRVTASLER